MKVFNRLKFDKRFLSMIDDYNISLSIIFPLDICFWASDNKNKFSIIKATNLNISIEIRDLNLTKKNPS